MPNMKILIIKNRYKGKINIKKGLDYFKTNTPVTFQYDEIETDFDLDFWAVGNAGAKGYVPCNYYDKLRKIVPEGKYHAVAMYYDNDAPGVRVSITENVPLYPDTDMITLKTITDGGKSLNHELFHTFFYKLARRGIKLYDCMDVTIVNGVGVGYYNNDCWDCPESNRTVALDDLKPYWNIIQEIKPFGIIKTIINAVSKPTVIAPQTYKYFKPSEVVGLSPSLVSILDKARDISQTPYKITSGYRDPAHNAEVGGVPNSSHTKGLAVDLECVDNFKRTLILKGLYSCGSDLFIEICKSHIHVDISTDNHLLGQTQWSIDD